MIKAQEKAVISAYELHFGKAVCGDDSQRLSDLHGCLQFSRRYWDVICNENPELSHSELGQVFVCSWEELPASAKKDMILDYELEVTAASFEAEMKMKAAIEDGEELLKQF